MNELIPYFGVAFLILVFAASAAFLAKRGLWIKKLKHDKTELEFDSAIPSKLETQLTKARIPSRDEIELTGEFLRDCEVLGLASSDVGDFILREAERHPILFLSDFYSLPLVFYQYVLLLSWDHKSVKAERLLDREKAYPINDLWSSCLAAYHKATMLPYRQSGPDRLVVSSEAKRALAVYRRLVTAAIAFMDGLESQMGHRPSAYASLTSIIEEAEFALASEDLGTAVARMEALLSTIHKLILHHAPQGTGRAARKEEEGPPEFSTSPRSKAKILIVDDQRMFIEALSQYLREAEYDVLATSDPRSAMRALVEYTFDIVITDMRMSLGEGGIDGREITLAAKKANPNTKLIVLTAYYQTTLMTDTSCDLTLDKAKLNWEQLSEEIDRLRQQQTYK